ncbi:uncharacterized protein EV420DRAFT_804786 [Desarmillaria tabescens]|uniref:Uncharacterized protein n=1 Tax=Armillaria tabescens TaxID=1929756 RepID=A0AA39NHZ7_ARMTA|nr:uncharacterized protein EV420DRAFT_804786 [Desarmillaria tabescens]KAK0465980.1 hypothetical protein EV420DRAFT_804786 [Desarmillaria tabescens]
MLSGAFDRLFLCTFGYTFWGPAFGRVEEGSNPSISPSSQDNDIGRAASSPEDHCRLSSRGCSQGTFCAFACPLTTQKMRSSIISIIHSDALNLFARHKSINRRKARMRAYVTAAAIRTPSTEPFISRPGTRHGI